MCPQILKPLKTDRFCGRSDYDGASKSVTPGSRSRVNRFHHRVAMTLLPFDIGCQREFHPCRPAVSFALDQTQDSRKMYPVKKGQ